MNGMMYLSVALFAYLIGSAPFALVVSKAMKLADPRSYGSGNPGATNVLRSGSLRAAALSVFMGHVWPVFFRFRGGRGVSTAAGILFAIHPALGAASAATWCIIALFFR